MRHFRLPVAPLCALLSLGALVGCGEDDENGTAEQYEDERVEKGLQLAPVPLNLEGKDRALVGLGSYIVNAQGGCNDCHTNPSFAPGGDPFEGQPEQVNVEGYLRGGRPFGPTLIAPGLRPNAEGRPGGEDLDGFLALMRTGRDNGRILQVMPWPVYQDMTDRDLRAIYEYLRALPQ